MIPIDLLTLAPAPSACSLAVTIFAIDLVDISKLSLLVLLIAKTLNG